MAITPSYFRPVRRLRGGCRGGSFGGKGLAGLATSRLVVRFVVLDSMGTDTSQRMRAS